MEAIDDINKELESKVLERPKVDFQTGDDVIEGGSTQKAKKPRSQAQKDAFEKARKKRAENVAKKKEQEVSQQIKEEDIKEDDEVLRSGGGVEKTPPQKKKAGRPKGAKNKKVMNREPEPTEDKPNYPRPVDHPIYEARDNGHRFQGQDNRHQQYQAPPQYPNSVSHYAPTYSMPPPQHYSMPPPQQPVHNHYYYGKENPDQIPHPARTTSHRDIDLNDAVYSSSDNEEFEPEPEPYPVQPPQPELKYRFA